MRSFSITSHAREEIIDITSQVAGQASLAGWQNGAVHLFCRHTTCGLFINENADPDVQRDLLAFFRQIAPRHNHWLHAEGNTDAHIRSSLLGVSLLIPLQDGKLCLGVWQGVYLYEGDGPRTRSLLAQLLRS